MSLFKIKRLNKEQRKWAGLVGLSLLVIIGFLAGGMLLVSVYPTDDYGTIHLYNERTLDEMDAGAILNVQDGDWMVAWLRDNPDTPRKPTDEDFSATLYRSDGLVVENGRDRNIYVSSYRWWFDLDQCPQGTFTYIVKLHATIEPGVIVRGESFEFQITNGEAPVYDDAAFTDKPDDVGFDVNESPAYISWTFDYNGPCVVDVTWDGTKVDSQTYPASEVFQTFTYIIDTSVAGIFTVVFTLTPDAADNPAISDTVMVTIAGDTDTTTTTTTPTTTPTTTTGTTTPPPEPDDEAILCAIGIAVGLGLIVILFVKGGVVPNKTKGGK